METQPIRSEYEDALVAALRILAARGRLIREQQEKCPDQVLNKEEDPTIQRQAQESEASPD